jgi:ABC-type glycerol-3-phosphate transport system permease component
MLSHDMPRPSRLFLALSLCISICVTCARAATHPATGPVTSNDVVEFLNHTIDWYHRIEAVDATQAHSHELLLRANVRDNAKQVVKLGLQFGRAEAVILDSAANASNTSTTTKASVNGGANLTRLASNAATRVESLQAQLAQLEQKIQSAPPTSQPALSQQRDRLAAQLNLAKAQQEVLTEYAGFVTSAQAGDSTTLSAKIDALERSVPEIASNESSAASAATAASNTTDTSASDNLLGILRDLFTINGRMSELSSLATDTQRLIEQNEKLRGPIRTAIVDAIHRADQLAATTEPSDASDSRAQLDALTARFKQLSAAGVPLGEQRVMLDSARQNLANWRSALGRESTRLLRDLLMRVGVLAIVIFVIVIAAAWSKRATMRYVHDARRRRHLLVIRRIAIVVIVVFFIIISVVSEFGSIATFAGLITAGIAVALQTVILSGVAYFFFIGRSGVRVGDRVTISNITGEVIEVGVFRLYLMELGGTPPDLHPTGRIVVFSNSVLFQPQAFYKQFPGAAGTILYRNLPMDVGRMLSLGFFRRDCAGAELSRSECSDREPQDHWRDQTAIPDPQQRTGTAADRSGGGAGGSNPACPASLPGDDRGARGWRDDRGSRGRALRSPAEHHREGCRGRGCLA